MQIKHIKNLHWGIFIIAMICAIIFRSNSIFLWGGIATAFMAIISIFLAQPLVFWLFGVYMVIICLPFAVPFLLLALFCKLFKEEKQNSIYDPIACIFGALEFSAIVYLSDFYTKRLDSLWVGGGAVIIVICGILIRLIMLSDEKNKTEG